MKITAYIHPWRTAVTPTGVGNHIIQMITSLTREPGVEVKLLTSRQDLTNGHIDARSPLSTLPALGHPLSRTIMERLWLLTGHPTADRWAGNPDWIYCPAETFVATRKASLAVTVHDTYSLEPDLPWSNTPEHKRIRWRAELMFKPIRRHAKLILAVSEFTKSRLVTLLDFDP
ncbi:MAG TPA: glycosyltransferase, partial [Tepidisphaeraceae bacterium]